jgi:hypothetical protein
MWRLACVALLLALATPASGSAQEVVRTETEDWVLTAPSAPDRARIDRGLDRVGGVETILR